MTTTTTAQRDSTAAGASRRADSYRSLLGWIDNPSAVRGVRFGQPNDQWEFWSYAELAEHARRIASGLIERGVATDDVVSIVQATGPDFIGTFFGALLAGASPSAIAPPTVFQQASDHETRVAASLAAAKPAIVVCDGPLRARLEAMAGPSPRPRVTTVKELVEGRGATAVSDHEPRARYAVVQFTSGSSGVARGVCVSYSALEGNIEAIHRWLQWSPDDAMASWLPVHHDMGLVGCLLWPVVSGNDLWLMEPSQFLRRPVSYLRCLSEHGATTGAIPPFGLEYVVRHVRPRHLDGLDFRGCKAIIVGAERIGARTLERFHDLIAPCGLRRESLVPAYGLAESTLAVTGLPLAAGWKALTVDPQALSLGENVLARGPVAGGQRVVSCGRPVYRAAVCVVDAAGRAVAEGEVGEVVVEGPLLAERYLVEGDSASLTEIHRGRLHTGDGGFLVDGELYVLGRIGDSMKIRGRVVFAEDLEVSLSSIHPRAKTAVLLGVQEGAATAVAIMEQASASTLEQAAELLERLVEGARVHVRSVPLGTISWTSSRKPRRRHLWTRFVEGCLEGGTARATPPHSVSEAL